MNRFSRFCCVIALLLFFSCEQQKESATYSYVDALGQMHAEAFREAGLTGKGVKIGVIDLGFASLATSLVTSHLFNNNQLGFMRQYYPDSQAVFFNHAEKHGFYVTFMMGGRSKRDSVYNGGLAVNAQFYLAKISKGSTEAKTLSGEEENIRKALDDFYARGVRLVNISMGYWDDFDDPAFNYTKNQMDGKSTRIAKICQEYTDKGMCIVAAAGNTGEYSWRYIWSPADVNDVITVGACNQLKQPFRASYSGVGNPASDFVKPDVVCYSSWGTSMSTPVITSLVAVMLEMDSTLSPAEIKNLLHKSSNLYPYPNNYVGYGVPDAAKILQLLKEPSLELSNVREVYVTENSFEISCDSQDVLVFQKTGPYLVKRQSYLKSANGMITVKRKKGILRSTVVIDNEQVFEIFWK